MKVCPWGTKNGCYDFERKVAVMDNVKMISEQDCEKDDIKALFSRMKDNNMPLYTSVYKRIRSHGSIRLDVLQELSENARDYTDDEQALIGFSPMIDHSNLTPDWYRWFNDYVNGDGKLSINEIMFLIKQAAEMDIQYDRFKSFFEDDPSSAMDVYKRFAASADEKNETEKKSASKSDKAAVVPQKKNEKSLDKAQLESDSAQSVTSTAVAVFDNLINVITTGRPDQRDIDAIQTEFDSFIIELQEYVRRLSVFMNNITREWSDDKVENERLKSLYAIEQQLLTNQSKKIMDLEAEIAGLNNKVRDAERTELRREAISRKLSELQSLTGKEDVLLSLNFPDEA